MLITMTEFAVKYDIDPKLYPYFMDGVEPVEISKGRIGKPAKRFEEKDILRAYVGYCKSKRDWYKERAQLWQDKAKDAVALYKEDA